MWHLSAQSCVVLGGEVNYYFIGESDHEIWKNCNFGH